MNIVGKTIYFTPLPVTIWSRILWIWNRRNFFRRSALDLDSIWSCIKPLPYTLHFVCFLIGQLFVNFAYEKFGVVMVWSMSAGHSGHFCIWYVGLVNPSRIFKFMLHWLNLLHTMVILFLYVFHFLNHLSHFIYSWFLSFIQLLVHPMVSCRRPLRISTRKLII